MLLLALVDWALGARVVAVFEEMQRIQPVSAV